MTNNNKTRAKIEYLDETGWLLIFDKDWQEDSSFLYLAINNKGRIEAFNGHVDLGTGIRTALAQIVAEELEVNFDKVDMVLGSTVVTPNQGATIASETIQITSIPLKQAAATAKQYLIEAAAKLYDIPVNELFVEEGIIKTLDKKRNIQLSFDDIIQDQQIRLTINNKAPLKPAKDYKLVGTSRPRVDIPAKATGQWIYVHDVRVPGMLHGRVIRPPYSGFEYGNHVGHSLISVDYESIQTIPGIIKIEIIGDFVGIVATREEYAAQAAKLLRVHWKTPPNQPNLNEPAQALRENKSTSRTLADEGNVHLALENAASVLDRTYVWPYQMHGSIGPSCAVADVHEGGVTIWSGTQNPYPLRHDIAKLLNMPEEWIAIERMEAAGCYGRNCADDVSADAALLSRAVGAPVRVQLTREQEHEWEPKGAAQLMEVRGGLDNEGGPAAYQLDTRYPSNLAPTLALLLTRCIPATPQVAQMGDRTAIPPYSFSNLRITVHDMPPIARASWFRGVSALPNTFAHESYIDELAFAAKVDPIEYRLRYLPDERAQTMIKSLAKKVDWQPHTEPGTRGSEGDLLYGRGFSYAVYVHGTFPGKAAAWAAWVADVAVNKKTGDITVQRVSVAQDTGLMINPDGIRHQIHGNVIQSTSRVLKEQVRFSENAVISKEWGGYPIITFPEVPEIDVLLMEHQDQPPLGAGESASVPSAAAIANAVFDATGIRFRELPLTPEKVLAALKEQEANQLLNQENQLKKSQTDKKFRFFKWSFWGMAAAIGATITSLSPWRTTIAPIQTPDPTAYSSQTIERGKRIAAIGACNVCHIGSNDVAYAGGRGFETPFGTVYASNITPDPTNGIGNWSFPAFSRAMREGISRDGKHLYPAHPYPSFASVNEADMQSLYAYMLTLQPSNNQTLAANMRFPFNMRWLMSGWNTLFVSQGNWQYNQLQSEEWNHGAYLVETLGHCSACHSPRNFLSAEKKGQSHLAGGFADGWEAPPLASHSHSPINWTADSLYEYLRTGSAIGHGSAAGPMAHVVESLADAPDSDIKAMAVYLSSLNNTSNQTVSMGNQLPKNIIENADLNASNAAKKAPRGARIFNSACLSCHNATTQIPSLALNTNLHSPYPDNVLNAVLHGLDSPALMMQKTGGIPASVMDMPSFSNVLDDEELADLMSYLRSRFAPKKPNWNNLDKDIQRIRNVTLD